MEGNIALGGALGIRVRHAPKVGPLWKVRNFAHVWPGVWRHELAKALGMNHMYAQLRARKRLADGRWLDYGLIGTKMITTQFCAYMVDQLQAELSSWGDFKYHETGTGTGVEAVGNTSLTFSTEMVGDIRGVGTQTEGTSVQYVSVATVVYDGTGGAITEHGLFNDTRANGGTLMDRTLFSAINVVAADSIEFTYTLTATAGG